MKKFLLSLGVVAMLTTACSGGAPVPFADPAAPEYVSAVVHDPSVFEADGQYYIIGSHMASAKTADLMTWEQISTSAANGNKLTPNVKEDFADALKWAKTETFWAGDVQPMPDGRYFMYYCNCEGSSPLGDIGLAIADNPEGPYENQGMFLKSGMVGAGENGTNYNATVDPNCVDPHAFFDADGNFWMVYGSYSGGIYILKMNPETGLPLEKQGYGRRLLGGNHSRIEGAYILYSPETEYYYLFLSFGGLDSTGGYNIRVCRSENPDGPYYDAAGNDMANCKGKAGSFFDDASIEPFGVKLMGGYQFKHEAVEPGRTTGYLSPGHNSALYQEDTGKYFIIFHQRFTGGTSYEVRVHEMFLNKDGWFTVAPFRYSGNEQPQFAKSQVPGAYKVIRHEKDINVKPKISVTVELEANGKITGSSEGGTWKLAGDGETVTVTLDYVTYSGRVIRCYDKDNSMWVNAFTALSEDGLALWGAAVAGQAEE